MACYWQLVSRGQDVAKHPTVHRIILLASRLRNPAVWYSVEKLEDSQGPSSSTMPPRCITQDLLSQIRHFSALSAWSCPIPSCYGLTPSTLLTEHGHFSKPCVLCGYVPLATDLIFFSTELQGLGRPVMVSISVSSTRPNILCMVGDSENDINLVPKEVCPWQRYFIPGPPAMVTQ